MAEWSAIDVINFAPEFCGLAIPVIDRFIAMAALEVCDDTYGDRAKYAGILLTAHLLSVMGAKNSDGAGGSAAGPVSGITVGQVSVNYEGMSGAIKGGALMASKYGMEFHRIQRLYGTGIQVL